MSQLFFDVQRASDCTSLPEDTALHRWAQAAILGQREQSEIALRIVDAPESRELNRRFRNRDHPTNVLSFPADIAPDLNLPLLGDLVICAPIVAREAQQQHKSCIAHWAHMVVHGTLHLQGYDHIKAKDAEIMERLEIQILKEFGFNNPYVAVLEPIEVPQLTDNNDE